jgi:hypothetical protein
MALRSSERFRRSNLFSTLWAHGTRAGGPDFVEPEEMVTIGDDEPA